MHLYYFNLEPKAVLRYVSETPLEVVDGFITITINKKEVKIPSELCFYFDGAMCLYASPSKIASLMDDSTSTMDNVVMFFSGFQKFVAPFLYQLSAQEKKEFTSALYSLNSYYDFDQDPKFCHIVMFYLEYKSIPDAFSETFDPKPFFDAIRG